MLVLVLATLAGALAACAPTQPANNTDPQHANTKPAASSGLGSGGY